MSLKPAVLERLVAFRDQLTFGGSSLGRRREELISFHVSAVNRCEY
ncbi:MAG: carboxymuconolactone decarboxylase family protein [Deltaproteobacteria bacterium]|nr:carboxymuconolactone decarboxylase family protein [Deltaproteobacteria bacterium]